MSHKTLIKTKSKIPSLEELIISDTTIINVHAEAVDVHPIGGPKVFRYQPYGNKDIELQRIVQAAPQGANAYIRGNSMAVSEGLSAYEVIAVQYYRI